MFVMEFAIVVLAMVMLLEKKTIIDICTYTHSSTWEKMHYVGTQMSPLSVFSPHVCGVE